MIAQDQAEVVAFLSAPHARGADKVEIIETHISRIFLSGDGAYKIKRAVKLPYALCGFLDGGTEARRL